jgi:hypothetical protein
MDTRRYREQHDRIALLARRLDEEARRAATPQAVTQVLATLERFGAELADHLHEEDEVLYPALMASRDPVVAGLARQYFAEMGGITDLFGLYRTRWTAASITAEPMRFARETRLLIDGLTDRIRRENESLYPAAEMERPQAA